MSDPLPWPGPTLHVAQVGVPRTKAARDGDRLDDGVAVRELVDRALGQAAEPAGVQVDELGDFGWERPPAKRLGRAGRGESFSGPARKGAGARIGPGLGTDFIEAHLRRAPCLSSRDGHPDLASVRSRDPVQQDQPLHLERPPLSQHDAP